MGAQFTSGPWAVNPFRARVDCGTESKIGGLLPVCEMLWPTDERTEAETKANAHLIAAAPDHALIAWALCVGLGRWEFLGDSLRGEFCVNGIRHLTRLDQFGVPAVTDTLRAELTQARGGQA
jgi:hypothetical protein